MKDAAHSVGRLRVDALSRGMDELAIAYGWSQIRLNEEKIGRQMTDLERYRMALAALDRGTLSATHGSAASQAHALWAK